MPKITEKPLDLSNFKPKTVSPSVLAALNPKPEPVPEPDSEPVAEVEPEPMATEVPPPRSGFVDMDSAVAQLHEQAQAKEEAIHQAEEAIKSWHVAASEARDSFKDNLENMVREIIDGMPRRTEGSMPLELKIALYETASQIYLKQRPEINQGSSPKPPKDWTVTKDVEEYSKAVESHMRAALSYSVVESKSIWANLFGEVLP